MGDDFPYVPLFRSYLVRQWMHARVSQGCCLDGTKMRIFWEMASRFISAFSTYLLDNGYMYGVSLQVSVRTWHADIFLGPLYLADFCSSA